MRRRCAPATLALAVAAAALIAGCGAPSADLFAVQRSGSDRAANLRLVVSDGGWVTCNGRRHTLPPRRLLEARDLARRLDEQAQLGLDLPPGPGAVLSYRVRLEGGSVRFSDSSRHLPRSFARLQQFTKDVGEDVCGIRRR
jgi:hypothetical protein